MVKLLKIFVLLQTILSFSLISFAQTTLYSEDFDDSPVALDHKGYYQTTTINMTGVTSFTLGGSINGSYTTDDWFAVNNSRFESKDCDPISTLDWISSSVNISSYTSVTLSADIVLLTSYSEMYVTAYYEVDGSGTWVQFGTNSDASGKTIANGGSWTGDNLSVTIPNGSSSVKIKISHYGTNGSSNAYHDNVLIEGTGSSCTEPTTAPSGISFSSITTSSMTVNWTGNGDGDMVLVVAKESGATLTEPTSGTSYTANTVFGSGTQIGTGNYVVYDADGTTQSVTVTGLSSGTTYDYAIYAYNSTDDCYYLADYETGSQATACTPPGTSPTSLAFSSVGSNSMDISWTAGSGTNSLVVVKESGATHTDPSIGVSYSASSTFGSGDEIGTGNYVCYSGTGTSFTLTGLTGSTTYNVSVYTFNTSPTCYNLTEDYDSQQTLAFNTFYINDNSTSNDIYTSAVGSDSNTGGDSDPFLTISTAISAASDGDVIYIDAGTYNNWENITLSKELTFNGAGTELTLIDDEFAGASTNYFMYVTADNVVFRDMTIQGYENNGSQTPGTSGQALTIGAGASGVLIEDVKLSGNGASGGNPSIVVLANCSVTIRGGGSLCNTWHTAYAGGIEANGNGITLNIEDCVVAYNYKYNSYDGGGLLIQNSNATTTVNISDSYLYSNDASDGGAISQRSGVLNVTDCIIDSNVAGQTSTSVYGGAVRMSGGTATYTRCRFINNVSNGNGTLRGGAIGVYSLSSNVSLTLNNCYFTGNSGDEGDDIFADKYSGNTVNIVATNTTFSSSTDAIFNKDADSFSLTNCGNPTVAGTNSPAVVKVNTDSPSSVPNPSTVGIVSGDCSGTIILPVEMLNLNGQCVDNSIIIDWSTATELNNNYFIVERSKDASEFIEIGTLEGYGNSNEIKKYKFIDKAPLEGVAYYRLQQVDYNGDVDFSKIVSVENDCQDKEFIEYVIFNSSTDEIIIGFSQIMDEPFSFLMYDVSGKLVMTERLNPTSQSEVSIYVGEKIASSIYVVNLRNKLFTSNTKLFIDR